MKKIIILPSILGVTLLLASGYTFLKLNNKYETANYMLNNSVEQLKSLGLDATYQINKGILSSSGTYVVEDMSIFNFKVDHGFDVILGNPINVSGNIVFSENFKQKVSKDEKQKQFFNLINKGEFINSKIMDVNAQILGSNATVQMRFNPIILESTSSSLPNKSTDKLSFSDLNINLNYNGTDKITQMVVDIGDILIDTQQEKIKIENAKFKKDFYPQSLFLGKAEFSAKKYIIGGMVLSNVSNSYDLLKKSDSTYSMKNTMNIQNMAIEKIEPNGTMDLSLSIDKLNSQNVDNLLSIVDDLKKLSEAENNLNLEQDNKKREIAIKDLREKNKQMIDEKVKTNLKEIVTKGFEVNIDKFNITSQNSGNLNLVFKLTVKPSNDISNFSMINNIVIQTAFTLKGGQAIPMIQMFAPGEIKSEMKKPDEFSLAIVLNQGQVFINGIHRPELSNMVGSASQIADSNIKEKINKTNQIAQ